MTIIFSSSILLHVVYITMKLQIKHLADKHLQPTWCYVQLYVLTVGVLERDRL
jgi:hypothetical protein